MAGKKKTAKDLIDDVVRKAGQPTLYRPEYVQEIIDFFDIPHTRKEIRTTVSKKTGEPVSYEVEVPNTLPTMAGFGAKIGVHKETVRLWSKAHPDFGAAYRLAINLQEVMLVNLTLSGLYNPQFAQFVAKNYTDMRDVKEHVVEDRRQPRTPEEVQARIKELDERLERLRSEL